jgi:phosphoglucosamine mutase
MTSHTRQLFGTDGIRGVAGEFPLSLESTYLIGRAVGHDLTRSNPQARVVIGQDTRESSAWIADRVALGLSSSGCEVDSAGVITTPGVAYLARSRNYAAGIVISASHNPWTDNGIKVFSGDGYKLPDSHELAIEAEIFSLLQDVEPNPLQRPAPPPSLPGDPRLREAYARWLAASVTADLGKLRVLVDCAHGAAIAIAADLFHSLGVSAQILNACPDGRNINEDCGALHPETVAKSVAEQEGKFDLGVTFDGDADRALFCDAAGRVVNGDGVMLLVARDMKAHGMLNGGIVVGTTMSNMGLEVALRGSGIRLLRANVGDKYVLEEMQRREAILGGEQSGHIIFRDGEATTGDGLLTALRVMETMARTGCPLAELVSDLKVFPQTIQNVRVREKVPFDQTPGVQQAIAAAEQELNGNGRIVVRYSGTEPLARVMVEAEEESKMKRLAGAIAESIQKTLGA